MVKECHGLYQAYELVDAFAGHAVGKYEWLSGAHQLRVVVHHLKRRMHVGRKVGLVDYENVTLRYSGTVLAGNLVAGGHVDDVDEEVDESRGESKGEVVASAFDKHNVGVGKLGLHFLDGGYIHRRVLAHGRVGARAGLYANDTVFHKHTFEHAPYMLGILGGDDVVGDNQYFEALFYKSGSDGFDKGGLAGSYRPAYSLCGRLTLYLNFGE